MLAAPALLLAIATGGFGGSDRAALDLAIAATERAPGDLSHLIVVYRREYLRGVRTGARQGGATDFGAAVRKLSDDLWGGASMSSVIERCGGMIGALLASEAPEFPGEAARRAFEAATAGPWSYRGIDGATASGDPRAVAASIRGAAAAARTGAISASELPSRIVTDATNLLWCFWIEAGGDRRAAKEWDEHHGPYSIAGAGR